jgi:hypothetical protein
MLQHRRAEPARHPLHAEPHAAGGLAGVVAFDISTQKYLFLHAPRQTGKTSLLINLMHYLNAEGHYRAL